MKVLSVAERERERLKTPGERDGEPCTNKDEWKWSWQRLGAKGVHHRRALSAKLTKWWERKTDCDFFLLIFSIWRKEMMDPSGLYLSAQDLEGKSKAKLMILESLQMLPQTSKASILLITEQLYFH